MSERISHSQEHKGENLDLSAEIEKNLKRSKEAAEFSKSEKLSPGEIKAKAEQHAISGKEVPIGEKSNIKNPDFGIYKEMKSQTYGRTMGRIRQQLPAPERLMSKVMHQKTIDSVSDAMSKTIARPSGILGGGALALIGSSILLYMAKKYGFEYNFFMFFILVGCGFVLGIIAELFIRSVKKARN
jgi:hypothetical protein